MQSEVPIMHTLVAPVAMYAALASAWAGQVGSPATRPQLLTMLSQWALETGNGAACNNYNCGGIKSTPGDGFDFAAYRTREVLNGKSVIIVQKFRAYPDLQTAADDYLRTVRRYFASTWPAILDANVDEYAELLHQAHYYTADEGEYDLGLRGRYAQMDAAIPHDATPTEPAPPPATEDASEMVCKDTVLPDIIASSETEPNPYDS